MLVLLAAQSLGCAGDAVQTGRWQGRVMAVDVYDSRGKLYPAAALSIERGPAYSPKGPQEYVFDWVDLRKLPDEVGGGRLPLLTEGEPNCIISRDRLPVGRRISVRGFMTAGSVDVLLQGGASKGVTRYRGEAGRPVGSEHNIVVESMQLLKSR